MSLGHCVWRDLRTPDVEAAQAFYTQLFGWQISTVPRGEATVVVLTYQDTPICGLIPFSAERRSPYWLPYFSVDDPDLIRDRVADAGGNTWVDPMDVDGFGSIAVFGDASGADFAVVKGRTAQSSPFCWIHLETLDPDSAAGFYEHVFDWEVADDKTLQRFLIDQVPVASMSTGESDSAWAVFVRTPDCEKTMRRAKALGATIRLEPTVIPQTGTLAVLVDPTGAEFVLWTDLART